MNNLKKLFLNDLNQLLKKIKKIDNKIIVFQTEIIPSAIYYNLSGEFISKQILKNIEINFIDKTILFPAFSNDFVLKKKYDLKLSKPYTGSIPNLALKSRRYYRSESPLHSFLLKGKGVKQVKNLKQKTTWGKGSVYDWLYLNNALWVSFNLDLTRGCAIHHMSEELANVPYRFFKTFTGNLYENKKFLGTISEKKFSYYLKWSKKLNFKRWTKFMRKKKEFDKITINKGLFANVSLVKNIVDRSVLFYKKNPFGSINF